MKKIMLLMIMLMMLLPINVFAVSYEKNVYDDGIGVLTILLPGYSSSPTLNTLLLFREWRIRADNKDKKIYFVAIGKYKTIYLYTIEK